MVTKSTVVLAMLLGMVTPTVVAQGDSVPVIRVTATGTVDKDADRAVMTYGVETGAATASDAGRANAVAMDRLVASLRRLGSVIATLETTGYSVRPRYDRSERGGATKPTGYVVQNNVTVMLDSLQHVGRVIDVALEAGANLAYGIRFELRDPEAAYHEALAEALHRARQQAETLARAAGRTLGPVLSIETAGGYAPPRPFRRAQLEAVAVDTPIEPGEQSVSATVTVTFHLVTSPRP